MKSRFLLTLLIPLILLFQSLYKLPYESVKDSLDSHPEQAITINSPKAAPAHPWNAQVTTATYEFDLDAPATNSSVSPKLMGLNFVWPFVQFNPETGQVLDQEVRTAFSELGKANFYRYPGGQWSEWYQWYWGIGPQEERPWVAIPPGRQPLPNTFGTIEFLETMQDFGAIDAMFTINYLTGNYIAAHKWIEFVNAPTPSELTSGSWTTNCWGNNEVDECWRYKKVLTVTQDITTSANTIAVSPSDISKIGFYLDPNEFDAHAANCDEISIDGYGQDGCEEQNWYEYKKLSLNVDNEWMIVDRVDGNTLTIRRADEARQEHSAGSTAYFWDYSNLEKAPQGYFAWLRSQSGFGGQREPYNIHYWEVGNEPFWAIVDGNHDGVMECNFWYPCVEGKSSQNRSTRIEEYIQFYNQVTELDDTGLKFGLDLRDYINFSDLAGDFDSLDCPTVIQGWDREVLDGVHQEKVNFVAPHYYIFAKNADNFTLVTHPDRFFNFFVQLDACMENEFVTTPEIVSNEFGVFYNEDHAYGWWSELGDDAGKWRDGLYLATLLARLMQLDNITGANYWNLIWPGFLGKPGYAVYPFDDRFYTGDFTQKGPTFELYRYFAKYTFNNYFTANIQNTQQLISEVTTYDGTSKTLQIDPLLVYATRSSVHDRQYSLFIINRSEGSVPVSITLNCETCFESGDSLTRIELRGATYESAQIQTEERVMAPGTEGLTITPGRLTYNDMMSPLSIVMLVVPHNVSGRVTDASSNPIAAATVSAGSGVGVTTDTDGMYTIPNLTAGTYTLTPSKNGYLFAPPTRTISVPPDATGQDFIILPAPISTTLQISGTTSLPTNLIYTDTQSLTTMLEFPTGAVTETTTLILTPTLATGVSGFAFAGHAFEMAAFRRDHQLTGLTFGEPVTATLSYSDQDIRLVSDESQLALWWKTDDEWEDAADTCGPPLVYIRDLANRALSVPICRLGLFALFGPTHQIHLPLVQRAS